MDTSVDKLLDMHDELMEEAAKWWDSLSVGDREAQAYVLLLRRQHNTGKLEAGRMMLAICMAHKALVV